MIYIIMISVLIGSINYKLGINIGAGIKINITDILLIAWIIYEFILQKKKLIKFTPIKYILLLLFYLSVSLQWGIINDAPIGESIRILRNFIYIVAMFWLVENNYRSKKKLNIYRDLLFFSWIAIINCLYNVIIDFIENSWFMYYRENASFQVFMFVFLLFYKSEENLKLNKKIFIIITNVLLGICILLSQERLQILAVIISIMFYIVYQILTVTRKKNITLKVSQKKIFYNIIGIIFIFIFIINILKIEFIQNYIEYFIKYRFKSVIGSDGFKLDGSLNARLFQVINILNRNLIYFFVGSGLGSLYLSSTGYIHIVDGMWLWIFKDGGMLGLLLLMLIYLSIGIELNKVIENKLALKLSLITILVLQVFTPNIMLGISDSIFVGYILALICLERNKRFE